MKSKDEHTHSTPMSNLHKQALDDTLLGNILTSFLAYSTQTQCKEKTWKKNTVLAMKIDSLLIENNEPSIKGSVAFHG